MERLVRERERERERGWGRDGEKNLSMGISWIMDEGFYRAVGN